MFKKTLTTIFIAGQLLPWPVISAPTVWAMPEPPAAPEAPQAPTAPSQPDPPAPPSQPDPPANQPVADNPPTPPASHPHHSHQDNSQTNSNNSSDQNSQANQPANNQSNTAAADPQNTATNSNTGADSTNQAENNTNNTTQIDSSNTANLSNDLILNSSSGGNHSNKNTGDGSVVSGDATVQALVQNQANSDHTSTGGTPCGGCGAGSSATNDKTGANSENTAVNNVNSDTLITNNNTANLDTGVIAIAGTGRNTADKNTGNGEVITGDANVGLTVVNVANTDIGGVKTSEFNVFDDHNGDILIDLSGAQSASSPAVSQSGNNQTGSDSTNQASTNSNTALTIVNNNDASVSTDLVVDASTGLNSADKNTGNGSVTTGDANVVTNVVNLVNNTIQAGTEIVVATVNIFGNLVGDIILAPLPGCSSNCPSGSQAAQNQTTGADSTNQASADSTTDTSITQNNQAAIDNQTVVNANTGDNTTDKNTGNSQTTTGAVNVQAEQVNVANTNVTGADGTWWIVVVNEAGRWVGKIFGSPDGTNVAASGSVDLGAVNSTTGADSTNQASADSTTNTSITQNNQAQVQNNVVINADTGHNSASGNTGDGAVTTGDVNVMSNVVNYVNNNILGGKVVIAFINVFGSWTGNVVTPGHKSEQSHADSAIPTSDQHQAVGGPQSSISTPTPTTSPSQNSGNPPTNLIGQISNSQTTNGSQTGSGTTGYSKVLGAAFTRDWTREEDGFLKSQAPQTQSESFKTDKLSWLSSNEGKLIILLLISLPVGYLAWRFKRNLVDNSLGIQS